MSFHFCLRERKCAFPARGGSWINSTLSGYTVARLAARLTDSLKAAVVYIGRLHWRASRDFFLFLYSGEGERRREKER